MLRTVKSENPVFHHEQEMILLCPLVSGAGHGAGLAADEDCTDERLPPHRRR
jgi:hypothetical protein